MTGSASPSLLREYTVTVRGFGRIVVEKVMAHSKEEAIMVVQATHGISANAKSGGRGSM